MLFGTIFSMSDWHEPVPFGAIARLAGGVHIPANFETLLGGKVIR